METAPIPLQWLVEDGTIIWANDTELRLVGYPREEYVGHSIGEFCVDERVNLDLLRRLQNGEDLKEV